MCRAAGGARFAVYDVENPQGRAVYVHSKVVVVDEVWSMVGSGNLNRRSWTHDSELSCKVIDAQVDRRSPQDPGGEGDMARRFARNLRLRRTGEHLDRRADDVDDLVDPLGAFRALRDSADALLAWHRGGRRGERPPGRLVPHDPERLPAAQRVWAVPVQRVLYDPDGRALRDRLRRR